MVAAFALLAAASATPAWSATDLPQIGTTAQNAVMLGNRQVPLPPGEWSIVSTGFGSVDGASPGPYGAILAVTLVQLSGSRVDAVIVAQTNALPVGTGWGPSGDCKREDLAFASELRVQAYDLSCAYIAFADLAASPMVAASELIASRGWRLAPRFLVVGFRTGNRRDVLDLRYAFNPESAPLAVPGAAADAAWQPDAVARDPARGRIVAALARWSEATGRQLEQRLAHPADAPEPLPSPWHFLATPEDVGADRPMPLWALTLYKDLTFRSIMMSSSAAVTYALSGNFFSAGIMPIAQGVTHFLAFYGVELGWEWPRHPPVQDFVAAPRQPALAVVEEPQRLSRGGGLGSAVAAPLGGLGGMTGRYAGFDGMQVPLPPGRWETAAAAREGEGAQAVDSRVLVSLAGGKLAGIVVARTNAVAQTATFGAAAECDRGDIHLAVQRYATRVDGLCIFIKHLLMNPDAGDAPGWGAARRWFRIRDRTNVLDIRYYFPPPDGDERPDQPRWADSVWAPARMASDPARKAHIAALERWTQPMSEAIERGFRDQLDADVTSASPWSTAMAVSGVTALDALRASGAIDDAQYREQLIGLRLREAEPLSVEMSFERRTFYKTLFYQAIATADSAAVSYLILGAPFLSLTYVGTMSVIAPVAYYLHEVAWAAAGVGKPPVQKPREFAEIGIDR